MTTKPTSRSKRSLRQYVKKTYPTDHRPVNLPRDYWERIDAEAQKAGASRSAYVKGMIEFAWASASEFEQAEPA